MKALYMKAVFTALVFITSAAYAQSDCKCNDYAILKKNNTNDSIAAAKMITSSSLICNAIGYEVMADFLIKEGNSSTAEIMLQKAESAYRKTDCGEGVLILTYKYWGQLLHTKGEFAKAQEKFFKMLTAAEEVSDFNEMAISNTMIAQMFNQTKQAEKGIVYTRKAAMLTDKVTDSIKKTELFFKIANRLKWHYQDTKTVSSLDSSELYINKQLAMARSLKLKKYISSGYLLLQGIEWERWSSKKSNPLSATDKETEKKLMILLDSALKYSDRSAFNVMGSIYSDKAVIAIDLKDFLNAKTFTDSSIYYWDKTGNIGYKVYGYENLAGVSKGNGDYKSAYDYYVKARLLTDSLANIERTKEVTEFEKKYSQAKNENTISELSKKKQLYLMLAIAGLLAALAIAFFLRQQSLKHKKNILETEQRLNRARMNPHFFFNALTALQKFALKENDGQAMASNLSKFSNIMRETLESTYKEYVTIEQEMEFLNEYLEVQKIRFPHAFTYQVEAEKNLDIDELQIPAMIIQPFVENSIEHGFDGADYPGNVTIKFASENKELLIEIKDNGKGLSTTVKENNEHISRASQIIKDRIYLLNIKLKTKAGFRIDNAEGGGVIVKIHLPLLYKEATKS
jgi:two-component sensor histidine kinase